MTSPARAADERQVRAADAVALVWCVLWLAVGVGVAVQVFELSELGASLSRSGAALDTAGRALQELRDVPLVGASTGRLGDEVRSTAADLVARGQQSQTAGRRLGVLLGVATAAAPNAPVLLLYVPRRLQRRRLRQQLRADLVRPDPGLQALLAHRALLNVPHRDLQQAVADPVAAFHAGQHGPLADAELRRLGLRQASP